MLFTNCVARVGRGNRPVICKMVDPFENFSYLLIYYLELQESNVKAVISRNGRLKILVLVTDATWDSESTTPRRFLLVNV